MSIATLSRKTKEKYHCASVGRPQFSLNGSTRNQGWVGQSSLSRPTYINNFSNNNNNIVKPSVVNATIAMKHKTQILPLNVVKNVQHLTQVDRMIACRKILLTKISKIPSPIISKSTLPVGTTIGGMKESCFTTKKIGSVSYGEHLFGLTKKNTSCNPFIKNQYFEFPILSTGSFSYYNNLTQIQKQSFSWISGGNVLNQLGPALINGIDSFNFALPFPSGKQCIVLQSNSFIQQSIFVYEGTYEISFMYATRSGVDVNPVSISIDNVIIGTTPAISVKPWRSFSIPFTVIYDKLIVVKFMGTSLLDQSTGIDNIIIS